MLGSMIVDLGVRLGGIFYQIVLPILLVASLGWYIQRRSSLDMATLKRLNFNFVMPAMIYYAVVSASVSIGEVGQVMRLMFTCMLAQIALTYALARLRGVERSAIRPMIMTTTFCNSGNYGLPLQEMAFRHVGLSAEAVTYQTFAMITQNLTNFTLGILIASGGRESVSFRRSLLQIVRFPPLYALTAAAVTVQIRTWLGPDAAGQAGQALAPLWVTLGWIKDAFVAVALLTLGAQLALVKRAGSRYPITMSVVLRLLVGPAIALGAIYAWGISGLMAQVLLVSFATPTAVNVMLLCLEFDNHPDFAARAVFYSTLASPLTVTLTVFLAQGGFLPGF